jgi:hypothetical protein
MEVGTHPIVFGGCAGSISLAKKGNMTLLRTAFWFYLLALWIPPACARGAPIGPPPDAGGKASIRQADLFDSPSLLQISLEIAPPALAALRTNADNHAYVRCSFREGSLWLTNVGIHCKGDTARQLLSGRPDFTITFDKFVRGQAFRGQSRLILQGSREDPSYLSAPIAFELFRQAGVPAPRCVFARVELNGRDLGLYVINEGEYRDFLRRHFGNDRGNLYDEGETHDVTGKLDKDHGSAAEDQSDVDALVAAAQVADPEERWQQLLQRLDMDRFLAFTALEVLLWNEESYALAASKFRLYHNPANDRLVFFPKGVERVLARTDGPLLPQCRGLVARAVLTTPEGRRQYLQTVSKLRNSLFRPDKVQARVREIVAAIRPVVAGNAPDAVKSFDAAVAQFQEAFARRAAFVAGQLKTLE